MGLLAMFRRSGEQHTYLETRNRECDIKESEAICENEKP
jgi:hypothetical protein